MSPTELMRKFDKELPHFDDGRINYTSAKASLTINCIVYWKGKILLLKRSDKVLAYSGHWNGIAGFVDRVEPIEKRVYQELEEEIGLKKADIKKMTICDMLTADDKEINRVWLEIPVLVEPKTKPNVKLDWEHTDFEWIDPSDLPNYEIIYKFDELVELALKSLS